MIKLEAGNVLLKPSHRKQLMGWLRRTVRMGSRLGNFVMTISLKRVGKMFDVRASVSDACGGFDCHSRRHDFRTAFRNLVRAITLRLHEQCLHRTAAA